MFNPLSFQPIVHGGVHNDALRSLLGEAALFCPIGHVVRVRENAKGCRVGVWAAYDCHFKAKGARAGKCLVTLIHRANTVFV